MTLWCTSMGVGQVIACVLAELLGTAVLMYVGCLSCAEDQYGSGVQTIILAAFGFGFAVLLAVLIFHPISGAHINPAVTLGVVIMNRKKWDMLFFYIPAQYIGSFLGYTLMIISVPEYVPRSESRSPHGICTLRQHDKMEVHWVFLMEVIGTMILVWIVGSLGDPRHEEEFDSVSIRAGLGVAGIVIAIGPFSGAGINPARALPPSVLNNRYQIHWVFQVAPYIGSALAAIMYRWIFDLAEPKSIANIKPKQKIEDL